LNSKPLGELKKYLAWSPGCSLLAAQATQVPATINSLESNPTKVIVNSGSDVTFIWYILLLEMQNPPKIRQGQRINLVQVTRNSSISRYVEVDLYFHILESPVKINVEAYVVKGMSSPFILGIDFADQYSILVIQQEGGCNL
jgi:hypothetical protein